MFPEIIPAAVALTPNWRNPDCFTAGRTLSVAHDAPFQAVSQTHVPFCRQSPLREHAPGHGLGPGGPGGGGLGGGGDGLGGVRLRRMERLATVVLAHVATRHAKAKTRLVETMLPLLLCNGAHCASHESRVVAR